MGQMIKDKVKLEAIKSFLTAEGFELPKSFDRKMTEAAEKFCGGKLPKVAAIANVIKACQYWKPYCESRDDFNKLVINECYKMARIQCSVISTHVEATSFIGNFCKVKGNLLPECTTTVANSTRTVVYEGMGAAEKLLTPLF